MKLRDILGGEIVKQFNTKNGLDDKKPFISSLKPGMVVQTDVKVISKRLQEARDGSKFLLLTLTDRTGAIRAVDWHNAEYNDEKLDVGTVVRVKGKIVVFNERLQLNLDPNNGISILHEESYDPLRFVSVTKKNISEMYDRLCNLIDSIGNDYLKSLLNLIFIEDKDFVRNFVVCPAAVKIHHAYKGGLLEHTLSVAELCDYLAQRNPDCINRDLLITGALLHDIGKTKEYTLSSSGIEKTDVGEILGHIAMGAELVTKYINKIPDFPSFMLAEIKHFILSHHGEMEWGSPVVPKTTEAMVLHMADNLDSKMAQFREIESREYNSSDNNWSNYDKFLNRRIFMKNRDENF
ncbi:MAG: HD domain-containing protein [Kosmotoga sp.]|nr:MAG: HD domain-containing protein [Kosmotoga sp.]